MLQLKLDIDKAKKSYHNIRQNTEHISVTIYNGYCLKITYLQKVNGLWGEYIGYTTSIGQRYESVDQIACEDLLQKIDIKYLEKIYNDLRVNDRPIIDVKIIDVKREIKRDTK